MKLSPKVIALLFAVSPLLILLLLFYAGNFLTTAQDSPRAVLGTLDLSRYSAKDKLIPLNGEWEFYWSKLLGPDELAGAGSDRGELLYKQVPGTWKKETSGGQTLSNHGYATYRLTVKLNPELRGRQLAIYMPSVATSYRLWINGRLSSENGVVGTTPADSVPKNYRKVVYFDADKEMELVVQVANYVQRKGGLWEPIRFGTAEQVAADRETRIVLDMLIIGSLCVMGLYHLCLFWTRRSNRAPLYFGLLCLAFALRLFVTGETLAVRLLPALPWEAVVKAEYISGIVALPLFMYFCTCQYGRGMRRIAATVSLAVASACCGLVLLTPAGVYTYIMLPFQIFAVAMLVYMVYVFTLAMIRKEDGAVRNYIALGVVFGTVVNDFLLYNQIIHTTELMQFGLVAYLFVQAVNLSIQFSRSFAHSERLSGELRELSDSLERKVRERTFELEQSNRKLQQATQEMETLEASRRLLLSNISHELKTPLTSIQGYTKAILDGIITDNVSKYLELIYQKSKILEHIFRDLLDLSKLETGKIRFHFETVPAKELLQHLFETYEWELKSKGLSVTMTDFFEPSPQQEAFVTVDQNRIEQVFANFIMNAKKFTPEGGSVDIHARIEAESGDSYRLVVNITDTGPGISEDELPYVFDRFYKGSHSRKLKLDGAGLGLAISKEIMQHHCGGIGVTSVSGAGSTFYFVLPVDLLDTVA